MPLSLALPLVNVVVTGGLCLLFGWFSFFLFSCFAVHARCDFLYALILLFFNLPDGPFVPLSGLGLENFGCITFDKKSVNKEEDYSFAFC